MGEVRRPKLFAFDIDGTLLSSTYHVLPSTQRAVEYLLSAGHHAALASARPPRSVRAIASELLRRTETVMVSLNGALVTYGDETLLETTIDAPPYATLVREARRRDIQVNLLTGWEWFVETYDERTRVEEEVVRFSPTGVPDLLALGDYPVHKLLFITDAPAIQDFQRWVQQAGLDVEATLSKPTYCEVVALGTSKAGALLVTAEHYGLTHEDIVAFGDGENDLPMIRAAGHGIAMGNAVAHVKAAAQFVTRSNDDDGIAHALTELGYLPPSERTT